ncbi:uncharacterized protein [Equus caballus]|uniref:uncharacterized protein n=1 Tax=Equus caballus TaxID=9796 RepID=UPI0038B27E67
MACQAPGSGMFGWCFRHVHLMVLAFPEELTPAVPSRPEAAPPTLPRGSAPTGRTPGDGAGLRCSASWTQRRLWTEHAHQRPPRRLRARARALASRSWRRDLRSGRAPGGSRAAVPPGLPRFGGLSDEPPRPEMFRLERHFPDGSGHASSSASIPFSRGSPSSQALDSLCSFPVEESQGGLISFGRCKTMMLQGRLDLPAVLSPCPSMHVVLFDQYLEILLCETVGSWSLDAPPGDSLEDVLYLPTFCPSIGVEASDAEIHC